MKMLTRRTLRIALLTAGLIGIFMAGTALPGTATPPTGGFSSVTLARGTDASNGTIPLQAGTDIVVVQVTVPAGGTSGWHSHPGGAIVVVKTGEVTIYHPVGPNCTSATYSAGQAFLERPDEVVDAVNNSSAPYVLYVTFPRVPQGALARTDEPDPGVCPGL